MLLDDIESTGTLCIQILVSFGCIFQSFVLNDQSIWADVVILKENNFAMLGQFRFYNVPVVLRDIFYFQNF